MPFSLSVMMRLREKSLSLNLEAIALRPEAFFFNLCDHALPTGPPVLMEAPFLQTSHRSLFRKDTVKTPRRESLTEKEVLRALSMSRFLFAGSDTSIIGEALRRRFEVKFSLCVF